MHESGGKLMHTSAYGISEALLSHINQIQQSTKRQWLLNFHTKRSQRVVLRVYAIDEFFNGPRWQKMSKSEVSDYNLACVRTNATR